MTLMPSKKPLTESDFEKSIVPAVKKLVRLCQKFDLPLHIALDTGEDIISEALYDDKTNKVFELAAGLTHGEFTVTDLGDGDYFLQASSSQVDADSIFTKPVDPAMVVPFNGKVH